MNLTRVTDTVQSPPASMDQLLRATARAETHHFWFRGFRAFITPVVRRAIGGREAARLLDCGCGTGANVELLRRFGHAFGFDVSDTAIQLAREHGRRTIARGSVTAAPFMGDRFDLVTSFDVLYALDDRAEHMALLEMYRLVKPGGYVLITVAALEALRGDHSVLSHEVRRYRREDLRNRVTAAGFAVRRITYAFASLFAPLLAARTWQRRRGLSREDDQAATREISVPVAPVNAAVSIALQLEAAWLRWLDLPFGSSLICLAQKPMHGAARLRT
jgi:SAM-dependent methyltransferase